MFDDELFMLLLSEMLKSGPPGNIGPSPEWWRTAFYLIFNVNLSLFVSENKNDYKDMSFT